MRTGVYLHAVSGYFGATYGEISPKFYVKYENNPYLTRIFMCICIILGSEDYCSVPPTDRNKQNILAS